MRAGKDAYVHIYTYADIAYIRTCIDTHKYMHKYTHTNMHMRIVLFLHVSICNEIIHASLEHSMGALIFVTDITHSRFLRHWLWRCKL